jgi:threonyl-tRNA synthetase
LDFEHPEGKCLVIHAPPINQYILLGKKVFWHSSAHVLGEACERHYGCHLCLGPPTEDGFFYEMAIDERPVSVGDYPALEKVSELAIKQKQKFERLVVPKETLLEMFNVRLSFCCQFGRKPMHRISHTVQQIQATSHQNQDSGWYFDHCLPLWANG